MLLPGTRLEAAWHVAERVRQRTAGLGPRSADGALPAAPAGGNGPTLSASFGVTEYKEGDTWRDLLQRAQAALGRAKRAGRNRCEVA